MNYWRPAWNSFSWRRIELSTSSLALASGATNSPSSACLDRGKTGTAGQLCFCSNSTDLLFPREQMCWYTNIMLFFLRDRTLLSQDNVFQQFLSNSIIGEHIHWYFFGFLFFCYFNQGFILCVIFMVVS